ncbi:hypothetical protein M2273_003468 [Mucilaginibacter lappiensis]
MITQEHIDNFSSELTKILNSELRLGNEIVETSKGWPNEETIMVFLKSPFIGCYKLNDIDYRDINDIHYWKAEYFDKSTNHGLACKFDVDRVFNFYHNTIAHSRLNTHIWGSISRQFGYFILK